MEKFSTARTNPAGVRESTMTERESRSGPGS